MAALAETGRKSFYKNPPAAERDACGIGFVAHVEGGRSHEVLRMALDALCNHAHRGAIADDGKSGDGAGILSQIPYRFFVRELKQIGVEAPPVSDLAVGQLFLNRHDADDRERAREVVRQVASDLALEVLAFRSVPVITSVLGDRALRLRPWMEQVVLRRTARAAHAGEAFERLLYRMRKLVLKQAQARGVGRLYVPSLSSRTIVYKGLVLADMLGRFYPDLHDPLFETSLAVFHQRYSTNTLPSWEKAQPFNLICHNGEINTLQGNELWMRAREPDLAAAVWPQGLDDLLPIMDADTSDSGKFDQQLELLVRSGRDIRYALLMMVPEAWERIPEGDMTPERRAFYKYHSSLLEPWDGPAAITYTDGRVVGTIMDRNGLRPARYVLLENGIVISASEMGAVRYDEAAVRAKGRLGPGEIFSVDTKASTIQANAEITAQAANRRPYGKWLADNLVSLEGILLKSRRIQEARLATAVRGAGNPEARPERTVHTPSRLPLIERQIAFGYTSEELVVVLRPYLTNAAEPVGAMGDDTPIAALSHLPRPLFHYFKQRFAEVTNPPIDSLRESTVMSLRMLLGERANLLSETAAAARLIELKSPILHQDHFYLLESLGMGSPEFWMATLDMTWQPDSAADRPRSRGEMMRQALRKLCARASEALAEGARILVLSDEGVDSGHLPIPSLMATSALHHHLVRTGRRMHASIVVKSGEPREVHHFAALIGYGANAVYPYLIYESISSMVEEGRHFGAMTAEQATENFLAGTEKGLLKIMSKMGISTLDSYCGGQVFEAIGISEQLIDDVFTGTPSLLGGVGYETLAEDVSAWHANAFPQGETGGRRRMPSWGLYKSRRGGEVHEWSPKAVHLLQTAVTADDDAKARAAFDELSELQSSQRIAPRHLLDFKPVREPVPLDEVEPAAAIAKRFSTAAMSHGALSAEAHETLAIAMNRIGGKSNSGEGGEDPDRYHTERVSKIKQVASGRFGVTPAYLMSAEELQIKMAQGSKPGEGGQLPGHKVSDKIAELRYATPGVALISPPPHHDIYSIEDLAQLIFDLKTANPNAHVSVKLVSEIGVGTIATGVAKGYADVIHIAGASGGTGASPLSSLKHVGLPWELGLAETHNALMGNGLRDRVILRTDGGISTGRDIVMAAMLGADEVSFGTSAMIAEGCIMARVCHKDTCPVGVATQNPALRAKFPGTPEMVMRFMMFLAEDARRILAGLGYRALDEVIGHPELLTQVVHGREAGFMDVRPLLAETPGDLPRRCVRDGNPLLASTALGDMLVEQVVARLEADPDANVFLTHPINNTDRTVGARLACGLALRYGMDGLRPGQINITFVGSAGQSFGAFGIQGLDFQLIGEVNDYVGKGLAGGEIAIRPHDRAGIIPQQNVIIGNTALYGATGGHLYASGLAGERFAVRNSGATAVVEGTGEHACEYMTGGTVVVLGETGRNFGAGMTGGEAFVYDVATNFERRYNPELIKIRRLAGGAVERRLLALIQTHVARTGSVRGTQILEDWEVQRQAMWHVTPQDEVHTIEARNEGMRLLDREVQLAAEIPAESRSAGDLTGILSR